MAAPKNCSWPPSSGRPDSPGLLSVLGGVFLIEKKPLNAAIAIKKAEALAPPRRSLALHRWCWPTSRLKPRRLGASRAEKLAASDPSNPGYDYWLRKAGLRRGPICVGRKAVPAGHRGRTGLSPRYDNLGLCYEALNQPDDAETPYRKAVELNARP